MRFFIYDGRYKVDSLSIAICGVTGFHWVAQISFVLSKTIPDYNTH